MSAKSDKYLDWIMEQSIEACTIEKVKDNSVKLTSEKAKGGITVYDIDGMDVVDMRLEQVETEEAFFFLHFELDDEKRAEELFEEMAAAVERANDTQVSHILLSCTCGITTTFFSSKLNECAQMLKLPFDFQAQPLEEALKHGKDFTAILLAPQVAARKDEISKACPNTTIIELPGMVFGSYDANAALRLTVDALAGARAAAASDLRFARGYDTNSRILIACFVERFDEPTISYQVFDKGEIVDSTIFIQKNIGKDSIEWLVATLKVRGYEMTDFDYIGLAVPYTVDNGIIVREKEDCLIRLEIAQQLTNRWGVPVRIDSCVTAGAAGCYVIQDKHDKLVFHAQAVGDASALEGYVINGVPYTGRYGASGRPYLLAERFDLHNSAENAAWRLDSINELAAYYLAATICILAPEAIFVWCDLMPDLDELHDELKKLIPNNLIPELIQIEDYDSLILTGELALCMQSLAAKKSA